MFTYPFLVKIGNIKIAGKWVVILINYHANIDNNTWFTYYFHYQLVFTTLKLMIIGFDPPPDEKVGTLVPL